MLTVVFHEMFECVFLASEHKLTGFAKITKVTEENCILGPGKTTWRNFAWTFLDCDSLVVVVQGLFHVDLLAE